MFVVKWWCWKKNDPKRAESGLGHEINWNAKNVVIEFEWSHRGSEFQIIIAVIFFFRDQKFRDEYGTDLCTFENNVLHVFSFTKFQLCICKLNIIIIICNFSSFSLCFLLLFIILIRFNDVTDVCVIIPVFDRLDSSHTQLLLLLFIDNQGL